MLNEKQKFAQKRKKKKERKKKEKRVYIVVRVSWSGHNVFLVDVVVYLGRLRIER